MSRSMDKCLSFFKVLKKKGRFGWDQKVEQAFQCLKENLERLPKMERSSHDEPLLSYLAMFM